LSMFHEQKNQFGGARRTPLASGGKIAASCDISMT
jgi:hypothetical protein